MATVEANKEWVAETQVAGKRTYLGCYRDEEAAARKYDAVTLGMPLNFDMSTPDDPGAKQTKHQRPARDVAPIVAHGLTDIQLVDSPHVRMTATI